VIDSAPAMTAYVFILVPIYVERLESTKRSVFVVKQKREQAVAGSPFWTWFIDNPRTATEHNS